MKKMLIIVTLIFGLAKLTASGTAPINPFEIIPSTLPAKALPFPGIKIASTSPLLPPSLGSFEAIVTALTKYSPQLVSNSFTSELGKTALKLSPVIAGYCAYHYYYYPKGKITFNDLPKNEAITDISLTVQISTHSSGPSFINPNTIELRPFRRGDNVSLQTIREDFIENTKTAINRKTSQDQTIYTFHFSGKIIYANSGTYELKDELLTWTVQGDLTASLQTFWDTTIATRLVHVPILPLEEQLYTGAAFYLAAGIGAKGLSDLAETDYLYPVLYTGLGIATLTKTHGLYTAHKTFVNAQLARTWNLIKTLK